METEMTLTVEVHAEDGSLWASVRELPGCFASGETTEELQASLIEAIQLYLAEDSQVATVTLAEREQLRGEVVERQRFVLSPC